MEDCDQFGPNLAATSSKAKTQHQQLRIVKTILSENELQRRRRPRARILSVISLRATAIAVALALLSVISERVCCLAAGGGGGQQPTGGPNEFQVHGQAGSLVRLPCLIGKRAQCGEPYFIAWYKLNATDRQWTRVEALSPADQTSGQDESLSSSGPGRPARAQGEPSTSSNRPLADRVQFVWSPSSQLSSNCWPGFDGPTGGNQTNQRAQQLTSLRHRQSPASAQQSGASSSSSSSLALLSALQLFDCAQLTIKPLEVQDEGQYKCEITFSETVEFDRCPVSTTTQLNVIVRPNEPELLLNGRPVANLVAAGNGPPTFKEGAQVRLECRSAGGRPAPRIEWLNLTTWTGTASEAFAGGGAQTKATTGNWMEFNDDDDDQSMSRPQQQPELAQLMRLHWPIKRATYLANSYDSIASATQQQQQQQLNNNIDQVALNQQLIPVTSSSIMITLSRFDLRSRFACLVLPQTTSAAAAPTQNSLPDSDNANQASLAELPPALRSAHALNQAADQVPMLVNARPQLAEGLMLKWVKLNVLAKPTSVSIRVLELSPVAGQQQQQQAELANRQQVKLVQQTNSGRQSFYSLRPNRLYAIQCLVENSRPRSQVAWFNGSGPLELDEPATELKSADSDLLTLAIGRRTAKHRLTSFVRHIEQEPAGTFRTISTLLLTTSFSDNFQELFCRVSNEAFQFEELVQVAPAISARIYVNYPPSAWLEAPDADWNPKTTLQSESPPAAYAKLGRLGAELGERVHFRCHVGANPLLQNSIVQIDWLKDGRRLTSANGTLSPRPSRLQIDRANHLHMPLAKQQTGGDFSAEHAPGGLATSARLLAASTLTIETLAHADAGLYSCQFKLIPTPSTSSVGASLQQVAAAAQANASHQFQFQFPQQANVAQANRIVSGQSSQAIQLTVIEAKLPILRLASSTGLLVYDHAGAKDRQLQKSARDQQQQQPQAAVLVAEASSELSLKCEHSTQSPQSSAQSPADPLGRRYLWYFDGALVHSSARDLLVLRPQMDDYSDELAGLRAKLVKANGVRLSCAQEMLEPGALLSAPGNFYAKSMKLFPSTNEIQLRFKAGPNLVQNTKFEPNLMPAQRSFSELELSGQPLSRLKLVCLAQCEPICSIDWLINKRQLTSKISSLQPGESAPANGNSDESHVQLTQELADNQQPVRLFKSFRRLEGSLLNSMRPGGGAGGDLASGQFGLIQVDNLIRREPPSSSHFIWSRQTSLGPSQGQIVELVSRELVRDSQELQASVQTPWNVMSKLELSYTQISQLLQASPSEQLLVECKLDETLGARQGFDWAQIKPGAFYPDSKLEAPSSKLLASGTGQDEQMATLFNSGQLDLKTLFGTHNSNRQGHAVDSDGSSSNTFQTQIILKRASASQTMVLRPTLAPPSDELVMQTLAAASSSSSLPANNFPRALSAHEPMPTNTTNNHLQPPPANNRPPDSSEPATSSLSPLVRGWFAGHQQLVLVGSCVLALLWLAALLVAPLMRRRLLRSPKLAFSLGNGAASQRTKTATNWRFNSRLCSRTSSTNEIGPFGTVNGIGRCGGGGGSGSSSTMMHQQNSHKFSLLQQQQPLSSLGPAAVANYYGAPESGNGADLSEHDMVQSCSQSSNYEDFIQHQQRLHQQPLYFNQAQLVESTTLSRRPLVQQSATNCHKQRSAAQSHAPATMRHNLSNVPLINALNQQTSSRINFSDLQRHSRAMANERYAVVGATTTTNNNNHHYSFGKIPPNTSHKRRMNSNHEDVHIYDDVG